MIFEHGAVWDKLRVLYTLRRTMMIGRRSNDKTRKTQAMSQYLTHVRTLHRADTLLAGTAWARSSFIRVALVNGNDSCTGKKELANCYKAMNYLIVCLKKDSGHAYICSTVCLFIVEI